MLIFGKFIFMACFGPDAFVIGKSLYIILILLHHEYNIVDCIAIGQTLRKLQRFVYEHLHWPIYRPIYRPMWFKG